MTSHSSILAWKIPWTEDPGGSPWSYKELDTTECLNTHTIGVQPIVAIEQGPAQPEVYFIFVFLRMGNPDLYVKQSYFLALAKKKKM